jgi:hypothetical protein
MNNPVIDALNTQANRAEGSAPGTGPTGRRLWNGNARIGTIYNLDVTDLGRVGNCWAQGRLKMGDNLLCVGKSGDAFYDYLLLRTIDYADADGFELNPIMQKIGAYQLGMPVCHLSDEEFQNLLAGRNITTDFKW